MMAKNPVKNSVKNFRELAPGSFVYALDGALEQETCTTMIRLFEDRPHQQYPGRIGPKENLEQSIKRSTDLRISGRRDWQEIDQKLRGSVCEALSLLSGLHPFFKVNRLHDIGYNMQRTETGEYYHWHIDSGPGDFTKRQLVAIWYLNKISDGGETEFYFQKLRIRPEPGMLILFPPFWTHLHRGKTLRTGTKYIATTWICVR